MGDASRPVDALDGLATAASELRAALQATAFPLTLPGSADALKVAGAAVSELSDYILPRLANLDAPALVVVGGSTGAGKSTLVNSVIGAEVTIPGVLRPTTRSPVLVCHPDAIRWFDDTRILPELARVHGGPATGPNQIQIVTNAAIGDGLAVLDAPDIDSVVDANRALAAQLLAAADVWVFVTTAARYADAVPWEFLHTARDRGTALTIVLNRVPAGALDQVRDHLLENLAANQLAGVEVMAVEEQSLTDGRIPDSAVAPLRTWLTTLANDHEARGEIVRRTLDGALADLVVRSRSVLVARQDQERATSDLLQLARVPYDKAVAGVDADIRGGSVLRGEVLARWQDLVGTGELLRQLQSVLGRLRDKLSSMVTGKATATDKFAGAVEAGVDTLVRARLTHAAIGAFGSWRDHPAGRTLLTGASGSLDECSPDLPEKTARLVRDWQGNLIELLKQEGAGKRSAARVLSYGVNGLAAVLMVGVFAHTGGLTGGEVAIAGGGSVVGQKLLEALLGDQAVRTLADNARSDLHARVAELAEQEWQRYARLVTGGDGAATRLDAAIAGLDAARG